MLDYGEGMLKYPNEEPVNVKFIETELYEGGDLYDLVDANKNGLEENLARLIFH